MKLKLQARQLWDVIKYGDLPHHEDRRTVEAFIAAVPQEMQMPLWEKATVKEAWDSLATARIRGERARRIALQRLRHEWELLSFRPGEQAEDFTLRLVALKKQLALHGDTDVNEERALEKLLRAAPAKYAQLCIAIETLLDFQDLTIEEVSGRLKAVGPWGAPRHRRQANALGGAVACPTEGEEERPGLCFSQRQGAAAPSPWRQEAEGQERAPRRRAAHVTEADSDNGALFFAHGVVQLEEKTPKVLYTKAAAFLDFAEPRARVFLGDAGDKDKLDGWYLDSGATHHMSGRREIFSGLDTTVHGTVKFGDASCVEI